MSEDGQLCLMKFGIRQRTLLPSLFISVVQKCVFKVSLQNFPIGNSITRKMKETEDFIEPVRKEAHHKIQD